MTAAKKAVEARGIADILAVARPRESEARLCLAGDLAAEADRIGAELLRLGAGYAPSSLADVDPTVALRAELDEVHDRMRAAEVVFRFRALPRKDYSDLLAAHRGRDGRNEAWNVETFPQALIAASCVEPAMTLEQCEALHDTINDHGRNALWAAAWRANTGEIEVPTSRAVSASLSSSDAR